MDKVPADARVDPATEVAGPPIPGMAPALGPLTPSRVLGLQRAAGNAAVGGLVARQQQLQRRDTSEVERAKALRLIAQRGNAKLLLHKHSKGEIEDTLDVAGLSAELLSRPPALSDTTIAVLEETARYGLESAFSVGFCQAATDEQLRAIAGDPAGMRLLFRLVNTMQGITTTLGEKQQLPRAMNAITSARGTGNTEVEVITFKTGFSLLDWAGQKAFGKGAKGHTAVAVAGLLYSFDERGWVMEGEKTDYLARNTHRDGIGQVLEVPAEDVLKIQGRLNKSIGTGAYLLDGRVCTDATAQALDAVLGKLDTKHNPQVFVQTLAATGKVKATRFYNKTPERGAPAMPSGPPGPPDFHGRPTR